MHNLQHGLACLAPPLSDDLIAQYTQLADEAPGPIRDALRECLAAVKLWWELPESQVAAASQVHIAGGRTLGVVPLEAAHQQQLFDAIPWEYELAAMGQLFESIDAQTHKPLRDAAFHLLWHCIELCHDREPLTKDRLK